MVGKIIRAVVACSEWELTGIGHEGIFWLQEVVFIFGEVEELQAFFKTPRIVYALSICAYPFM